jgi:HSP20 family protein
MTDIWDDMLGDLSDLRARFKRIWDNFSDPQVGVYGYTMYRGPDGVPHVHEFGTGANASVPADGVREPLTDVTVDGNVVRITVELPGVVKEDIRLDGTETSVTVSADTETRKFRKTVPLPTKVDPDSAKAEYNNGILEITMDSKNKTQASKRIEIV